jgi:hypothetical protein
LRLRGIGRRNRASLSGFLVVAFSDGEPGPTAGRSLSEAAPQRRPGLFLKTLRAKWFIRHVVEYEGSFF